jgi:hypothetical protein
MPAPEGIQEGQELPKLASHAANYTNIKPSIAVVCGRMNEKTVAQPWLIAYEQPPQIDAAPLAINYQSAISRKLGSKENLPEGKGAIDGPSQQPVEPLAPLRSAPQIIDLSSHLGPDPQTAHRGEIAMVNLDEINPFFSTMDGNPEGLFEISRDAQMSGKVIGAARGNNPQGCPAPGQTVQDFIHRAIAAYREHLLKPFSQRLPGQLKGVTAPRGYGDTEVPGAQSFAE